MEAWEEGTVGWASVMETIDGAEQRFDARATYVPCDLATNSFIESG